VPFGRTWQEGLIFVARDRQIHFYGPNHPVCDPCARGSIHPMEAVCGNSQSSRPPPQRGHKRSADPCARRTASRRGLLSLPCAWRSGEACDSDGGVGPPVAPVGSDCISQRRPLQAHSHDSRYIVWSLCGNVHDLQEGARPRVGPPPGPQRHRQHRHFSEREIREGSDAE